MVPEIVSGDLLAQPVDVIVNAWNQNRLPWWLLRPHGVSGAIKRAAGDAPFRELARAGRLRLGEAVLTGAGYLDDGGLEVVHRIHTRLGQGGLGNEQAGTR